MKRIWAPWRIQYVQGEREEGCVFCNAIADTDECSRLVVHKSKLSLVMLNKFPYIGGHLLVAPCRHTGASDSLTEKETLDLIKLTNKAVDVLKKTMKPHGFNIGVNIGEIAGAGIPDHIHIHIVPRWAGDTNFVPVFSDARIINEHLSETWKKLRANWKPAKARPKGKQNSKK